MYVGCGNIGYLTDEKKAPKKDDPSYATWDAENSMIMSWLVNSMDDIGITCAMLCQGSLG